jgi:hypothetical protein
MSRTLRGLGGAAPIPTRYHLATDLVVRDVVSVAGVGLLHGPTHTGKTYSADAAVASLDVRHAFLEAMPGMEAREFTVELLRELTGECDTGVGPSQLLFDLRNDLAKEPLLLVLDGISFATREVLRHVRQLQAHRDSQLSILLIGREVDDVLGRVEELRSQIVRRVEFKPLSPTDVITVLPAYHPVFAATDKHVLLDLDEAYAHGLLGSWAKVLQTALPIVEAKGGGGLTPKIVRAVRAVLP